MKTRLSKIAQLPKLIRDDLNHRLENGKQGPELLQWLNALPETKELLAEKFEGRVITHQNLSEWRRGGHQDWLEQQHRREWFDRFTENETELKHHDTCGDSYEAMSRLFLFEIGQGLAALPHLKNSQERALCLQNLAREFSRLQNAYNFSRRTQLDFDKYNQRPDLEPLPQIEDHEKQEERNSAELLEAPCRPPGPSRPPAENPTLDKAHDQRIPAGSTNFLPLPKGEGRGEGEETAIPSTIPIAAEKPEHAESPTPVDTVPPTENCGLKTVDTRPTPAFQPIPTPAPTTPIRKPVYNYTSIRGRRRRFAGIDV